MKKIVLTVLFAFGLVAMLYSCRDEIYTTQAEKEMIDKDEIDDDDI